MEPLIQALQEENDDVRLRAADALGEIGDSRAIEPLVQALRDEDRDVQFEVAEALGMMGERAVEPLMQALRDEDHNVRWGAASALGKIGDSRAVEPLIQALKDEDEDFQEAALASIRRLDLIMYRELITKDAGSRLRQFTDSIHSLIRDLELAYKYSEKFEGDGTDRMEVYVRECKIRKIFADILEKTIDLGFKEAAISDGLKDELLDSWRKISGLARERWQTPEMYGLIPEIADEIASGYYPYSFKTEERICQSVQTAQEDLVSAISEWLRDNRFQVIVQSGWLVWGWRKEKPGIRGVLVTIEDPLTIRLWGEAWTEEEATLFLPRFWQFVEELDFGLLPVPRTGRVFSWERWRDVLAGKGLDTDTIRSIEETLVYCYASSLMGLQSIPPSIIPHLELLSDPEIGLIQVSKCRDDPFSYHEAKSCRIKLARLTDAGLSLAREIHLGTLDKRIEELTEALSRMPERERGVIDYIIGERVLRGESGSWDLTVPYFNVVETGYFPPRFYPRSEEKTIFPPEMCKAIEDIKEKVSSLFLAASSWDHNTSGFTESRYMVTCPETNKKLSGEIGSHELDSYLRSCIRFIQFLKAKLDLLLKLAPYGLRGHFYNTRPHLYEHYGGMIMNVDIRRFAENFEISEMTILSWLRELHDEFPELISKIDERAMDSTEDTVVCNIAEEDRYELGEPFGSIISYPKLVDRLRAENADEAYLEVLENIKEWLNTGKKRQFATHLKIEESLSHPLKFSFP